MAACAHHPAAMPPISEKPTGALRTLLHILRGVIDEITDQRAYRTHLAAHGTEHSAKEWRRFCDEHYKAKGRRGTCC